MSKVVQEIRRYAERHDLSGPGVVAVSGGADSVALLRALAEAAVGPLTVAHVNHQLRGEESDGDERFVEALAKGLNLDRHIERRNITVLAEESGENLEATARRVRYECFERIANAVGAGWIATGHTADDQAETVLHRLLRGTGIQGLRGIADSRPIRDGSEILIVRPMLALTRADILDYLHNIGEPFREDSSNSDPRFTRNRIRHELIPLLKTFNPVVVDGLGRLANQAEELFFWMRAEAERCLHQYELPRAGDTIVLDAVKATAVEVILLREGLRLIWERELWPRNPMTEEHWNRLVRIVRGDAPAADFPGRVHVRRVRKVVQLTRRS